MCIYILIYIHTHIYIHFIKFAETKSEIENLKNLTKLTKLILYLKYINKKIGQIGFYQVLQEHVI